MNITDVRVHKFQTEGKLRGVASITIDDEFVVHDIKIIEGSNGLFIAMPTRKTSTGELKDITHPIRQEVRTMLSELILSKYAQTED